MQVAENALDGVGFVNTTGCTSAHDFIDRFGAQLGDLCRLSALHESFFNGHAFFIFGAIDHALVIAEQDQFELIGGHHGFTDRQLRVDIFGSFGAVLADKCCCALAEAGNRAIGGANTSGRNGTLEYLCKWNAVQPAGVGFATWATCVAMVVGSVSSVNGHEGVLDHDIVAACGTQAQYVEVFDNFKVGFGQQECAMFNFTGTIFLGQQAAQQNPFAMLYTTAPAPATAEFVAAIDRLCLANWHVG